MAPASKHVTRKLRLNGRKRSIVAPAVEVKYAVTTDENVFEVEAVIGRRFIRGGVEFLIRWKGFSEEHNTWEPAANLSDAALEVAEKFMKRQKLVVKESERKAKKSRGATEETIYGGNENGNSGDVSMQRSNNNLNMHAESSEDKKMSRVTDDTPSGHQLSPYEQARLDRIKRNEERLASLGLFDAKKKLSTAARGTKVGGKPTLPNKRRPTRASASAVTPSPTRSSRRLKLEPERYEPLLYDDIDIFFKKVKQKTNRARTSSGFKCDIPMDISSSPLTEDEKAVLKTKMGGDFMGKFEDYLTQIDTLSDQNRRNVLRQITKLASGEGIRYESHAYGWPEGCYFLDGIKVGPADDILKLMDIGRECEEKWGKDHGNGWLLSHPLKKLYMFQQYYLQQD